MVHNVLKQLIKATSDGIDSVGSQSKGFFQRCISDQIKVLINDAHLQER